VKRGFTLLEVIVAVALLGVGVGTAMHIFSSGLKNVHRIGLANRAMNHAENVMNEILSDESIISPTSLSGDLDPDFNFSAEVEYWEPEDQELSLDLTENKIDLLSIVVDVNFKNDRFGKRYRVVCLKAVSLEPQLGGPPFNAPPDPIQQLFGRR
jgi:prepilin-type N-terminal cleavage/methylation domain-containing protein